ncbi:hypothetical protein QPK31_23210 [Massilia sp. YIM B02769]|uniref:hypothetical protein n=1 Tax=Massilia sp. YIM B02769 TaxID=3050129 RepID=UPI0025B7101A|nr:hypothetical protein [Massilia sp. YIM B02769]MDN4061132.1 hypothetical protein [Massilia sp. YIM B02769]
MENPFDQFDAPAAEANVFDQFDAPAGPLKFDRGAPSGGDSTTKRSLIGAALGVADLGNTALNLAAYLPSKVSPAIDQWNKTRNADFEYLTEQNKDSTAFNVGRVGGNVAATLPAGGVAAQGIRSLASVPRLAGAAPALTRLANATASGGMRTGAGVTRSSPAAARAADVATRTAGGAITGAASTALVRPEDAGAGAVVGAILPGFVKVLGAAGGKAEQFARSNAERLMQSALKPTIKQLQTGEAQTAIETLLKYGINPTMKGADRLKGMIDDLNQHIEGMISNSSATVSKQRVILPLEEVKKKFAMQVSPTADRKAIESVADDFMAHPEIVGDAIPVSAAQKMKQGTYQVLKKKYGQLGSAEVEAQKALARGLKNEIATAVPEVAGLNAAESKLIATLGVAERRALIELNKNPMGLAGLAHSPASWAAFMIDKSALFKSLAARMVNGPVAKTAGRAAPALQSGLSNPALRNAGTAYVSSER